MIITHTCVYMYMLPLLSDLTCDVAGLSIMYASQHTGFFLMSAFLMPVLLEPYANCVLLSCGSTS